jgi:protein-tyrosine phosphatase
MERAEHPNAIPGRLGIREVHCEVLNDVRADMSVVRLLVDDPTPRGAERLMVELYRRLPGHMADTMRTLVDLLLDDGAPLLIHCSAGKDRTGFAIAMLLRSLEVPDELIVADYLESRAWPGREGHRASLSRRLGVVVPESTIYEVVSTVLDVREAYLEAALEATAVQYGSIERYLESEAGLDAAKRERLRARLLA